MKSDVHFSCRYLISDTSYYAPQAYLCFNIDFVFCIINLSYLSPLGYPLWSDEASADDLLLLAKRMRIPRSGHQKFLCLFCAKYTHICDPFLACNPWPRGSRPGKGRRLAGRPRCPTVGCLLSSCRVFNKTNKRKKKKKKPTGRELFLLHQ